MHNQKVSSNPLPVVRKGWQCKGARGGAIAPPMPLKKVTVVAAFREELWVTGLWHVIAKNSYLNKSLTEG